MSVKEGYLKKWSDSKNRWVDVYCKLLPSGWLQWFSDQSSTSPKRSVNIHVAPMYLAFGDILDKVPIKPIELTHTFYPNAFAVPHEPRQSTPLTFFLCSSTAEMNHWRTAIFSLLNADTQHPPPDPTSLQGIQPPSAYYPPYPPVNYTLAAPNPSYLPIPANAAYPVHPQIPNGVFDNSGGYAQPSSSGYPHQPVAGHQFADPNGQPYEVVYVDGRPKKNRLWQNIGVGVASGLAGSFLGSRLFGGPFMGLGGGFGRWGSWSSLSSLSWSD